MVCGLVCALGTQGPPALWVADVQQQPLIGCAVLAFEAGLKHTTREGGGRRTAWSWPGGGGTSRRGTCQVREGRRGTPEEIKLLASALMGTHLEYLLSSPAWGNPGRRPKPVHLNNKRAYGNKKAALHLLGRVQECLDQGYNE